MRKLFYIFSLNLVLLFPSSILAQEQKFISAYKNWYVFTIKQKSTNICFLISKAAKSEGNYSKRGDVLFVVTHRPVEKELGVINFRTGYNFRNDMDAVITINNNKFSLFTQGSDGWAKDSKTDKEIVKAMIRGSQMLIEGISSRGTKTIDTFSLSGFTAAYKAASNACNVK
jgi:invasion protein IalB